MKTIYRYELPITDQPTVTMPAGATILPCPPNPRGCGETIEIWAEIDNQQSNEIRHFRIVGTGHPLPSDAGAYVGTVTTHNGAGIWHVYEA